MFSPEAVMNSPSRSGVRRNASLQSPEEIATRLIAAAPRLIDQMSNRLAGLPIVGRAHIYYDVRCDGLSS